MNPNIELSQAEEHVLRHALTGGTSKVYRNYFVAGPGHTEMPQLLRLIELGFMERSHPMELLGGDAVYRCTPAGAEAVGLHLPGD